MTPDEEKDLDAKYPTMGDCFKAWDDPLVQKWFQSEDKATQDLILKFKEYSDLADKLIKRHREK